MAVVVGRESRLWRTGRRADQVVLPIEDDLFATADWLVAQRLLADWDADDRAKVKADLEFAIAALTGQDDQVP
jgi:hypothetical protein